MFQRMLLIRRVSGMPAFISTSVVLCGCIGIPILELAVFGTLISAICVLSLTFLGWIFRKAIAKFGVQYSKRTRVILFLYGVALVAAKYLGGGYQAQTVVIAIATAIMFNLNFWSIPEGAILKRAETSIDA